MMLVCKGYREIEHTIGYYEEVTKFIRFVDM